MYVYPPFVLLFGTPVIGLGEGLEMFKDDDLRLCYKG